VHDLTRSLAWFRPETALALGLLAVVLVDSTLVAWRGLATRAIAVASLAVALAWVT